MKNIFLTRLNCVLAMGLFASGGASGGYIANKADWDSLSANSKAVYAMAMADQYTIVFTSDTDEEVHRKQMITTCLSKGNINTGMLADAIDAQYNSNQGSWPHPPYGPFVWAIEEICSIYLD